jgi:3',5'-cyclic AMP phosphodiesterase CpdA
MNKRFFAILLPAILLTTGLDAADAGLHFAVVGDTQGMDGATISEEAFGKIVGLICAVDPPVQFVLQTGDLIEAPLLSRDRLDAFELWRSIASPWYESTDFIGLKVYPVPGNHDQPSLTRYVQTWQEAFPELPENGPYDEIKRTYSFDLGSCHFAAVNTSEPSLFGYNAVDTNWLTEDLAETKQPIKFVYGHAPAYPCGHHIGGSLDARPERRDIFWQTLVDNGVSVYFCGHEHVYDHWIKDGVHQIITGSGGVPAEDFDYLIVDVDDDNNVTVSVYDANDNSLMDQYDLADTANVACEERVGEEDAFYEFIDSLPCVLNLPVGLFFGYCGLFLLDFGVRKYE